MATGTNLEQDILQYRLNANAERRLGNTAQADGWDAEADAATDRLIAMQSRAKWDVLKGASRG